MENNPLKGDTPDLRAWNLPIAIDGIEVQHYPPNDTDLAPLEVYVWFNGHKAKIFSERILPGTITGHHISAGGIRAALVGDDTSVKVED